MDVSNAAKRPDFWLSIALIGLLFGLWVNVYPYGLRGYDMFEAVFKGHAKDAPALFLVLLMPVGLAGTIIACLRNDTFPIFPILAGIGAISPIIYFLVAAQKEFGISIQPSGWATALVAVLLGLTVFIPKQKAEPEG
jgi:hypothetical protein